MWKLGSFNGEGRGGGGHCHSVIIFRRQTKTPRIEVTLIGTVTTQATVLSRNVTEDARWEFFGIVRDLSTSMNEKAKEIQAWAKRQGPSVEVSNGLRKRIVMMRNWRKACRRAWRSTSRKWTSSGIRSTTTPKEPSTSCPLSIQKWVFCLVPYCSLEIST